MSLLHIENIKSILERKQSDIAERDQEYAKKLYSEKLFNDTENKKHMETGCEILAEKLKNIALADVPYAWSSDIKHKLFTPDEYEKIKNIKYFYTGCNAMKDFVKSFNKKGSGIVSMNVEKPFVNRILLNENKIKENKLHYDLKFEQEYKDVYHSGYPRSYYEKVPIHPSSDSVFFGFD